MLTGSKDGTAKIWDVAAGECVTTLIGHQLSLTSAVFSHDGASVLTGSEDGTAKIWDVAAGDCVLTFAGHGEGAIRSAVFPPHRPDLACSAPPRVAAARDSQACSDTNMSCSIA